MGQSTVVGGGAGGRCVVEFHTPGAALTVVIKEPGAHGLGVTAERIGHCYSLRPPPPRSDRRGWRDEGAEEWAAAWARGVLPPVQRLLAPRVAGCALLEAASSVAQAQVRDRQTVCALDQIHSGALVAPVLEVACAFLAARRRR
eukprot:SAG11_NODE_1918_length_4070_cov_2.703097_3_plen_144_part_00